MVASRGVIPAAGPNTDVNNEETELHCPRQSAGKAPAHRDGLTRPPQQHRHDGPRAALHPVAASTVAGRWCESWAHLRVPGR